MSVSEGPARTRFWWLLHLRDRVRAFPGGSSIWRVGVAVVGLIIIGVGVALLALPGPGWVVIFLGLGVWASEFEWASRLQGFARAQVKNWTVWLSRRSRLVQALIGLLGLAALAAVFYVAWLVLY